MLVPSKLGSNFAVHYNAVLGYTNSIYSVSFVSAQRHGFFRSAPAASSLKT